VRFSWIATMSYASSSSATTKNIQILIEQLSGQMISLEVPSIYNIDQVKLQIARHEGIPHSQQELVFGDNLLDGRLSLTELGISDGAVLQLVICDDALSSSSDEVEAKKCIVCGHKNEFYMVTPACRYCSVQQSREFDHFRDRR
jgi:hypothetical protein